MIEIGNNLTAAIIGASIGATAITHLWAARIRADTKLRQELNDQFRKLITDLNAR